MSTDAGELTASVPGEAITLGAGKFATACGTSATGAGSAVRAFSAPGGAGDGAGWVPGSSVDTSSGTTASSVTALFGTDTLKICGDASTGFDLVLNRGKPATTRPRTKKRPANVHNPACEVRLGITG